MAVRIRLRYDNYSNWVNQSIPPILELGEFGVIKYPDNRIIVHVGDSIGGKQWNLCPTIGDKYLNEILDVQLNTQLSENDILRYDGEKWVNYNLLSKFNIDSDGNIDVATQTFAEQILQTIQELSECVQSCCATTNNIIISNLNDLSDVNIQSPAAGQILYYNGQHWTNSANIDSGNY